MRTLRCTWGGTDFAKKQRAGIDPIRPTLTRLALESNQTRFGQYAAAQAAYSPAFAPHSLSMPLKIHHLNCGSMCPACQRLVSGQGSWREPGKLVCHCLLIETLQGLVLVDSGIGHQDVLHAQQRLGKTFLSLFRPRLLLEETALVQVQGLGFNPQDVRHIITTHLDLDHAGGLADFPHAKVHIFKPELQQILHPGLREKLRFRMPQFAHQPQWVVHEEQGEDWMGFSSIRAIPGLDSDILIVPLIGHTKGHVGVAVRDGAGWLLHCGDAYYHHSQITQTPDMPLLLKVFELGIQALPSARIRNLARLRELSRTHESNVALFCAHDPVELARYI